MPGDAAFCPSCGAASGALAVEVLDPDGEATTAEVRLGERRRRWIAPAVLLAVVALVITVLVAGGGSEEPAAAPTTTSTPSTTAAPTTTSRARPSTTTTTYSQTVVPPMPDAAGVVVYEATANGDVLRIDLGTGDIQRQAPPIEKRNRGALAILARRGGYIATDSAYDDQTPLYAVTDGPDPTAVAIAEWLPTERYGSVMPRIAPAAEPDEVWVWNDMVNMGPVTVTRIRLDGTVTAGPVTLPRFGFVVGPDGPGSLLLQGTGGLYRATVVGQELTIERIWDQVPMAYSTGALLDLECGPSLDCHHIVVDRATGEIRPVPAELTGVLLPNYDTTLSVDGRWLSAVDYNTGTEPEMVLYDLVAGREVFRDPITPANGGFLGMPRSSDFSPDGRWLVWFHYGEGIRLWRVGSDQPPVSFEVSNRIDASMISVAPG